MKLKTITASLVGLLLAGQIALAESPKVERNVGNDGVTVITITGDKTAPKAVKKPAPVEVPKRKAFRVYELEGDPAPKTETKIVVVSSPPPIAPNYNYGYYGWYGPGYGPGPEPCLYDGYFPGRFYNNGLNVGFRTGHLNYQNPPVNYQNPPVNYTNPPANYRPVPTGSYYYRGGRCR
jgi:hypothetical protein